MGEDMSWWCHSRPMRSKNPYSGNYAVKPNAGPRCRRSWLCCTVNATLAWGLVDILLFLQM